AAAPVRERAERREPGPDRARDLRRLRHYRRAEAAAAGHGARAPRGRFGAHLPGGGAARHAGGRGLLPERRHPPQRAAESGEIVGGRGARPPAARWSPDSPRPERAFPPWLTATPALRHDARVL